MNGGSEGERTSRSWGERWQTVLDGAGASAARKIQRGQALARRGAVEDLTFEAGAVTAMVAEDRLSPYRVELTWDPPAPQVWDEAVDALRSEVRFTAALLDGTLPAELVTSLEEIGITLLPGLEDLGTSCSCPDRAKICRHVAAVHGAAGTSIDRDPTVLLRLRGRSSDELLRELRRGDDDRSSLTGAAIDLSLGLEQAHGDLDAIELRPAPVDDPAALLGHLGDPPGVDDVEPLFRIVERAAAGAWRLAAGDGSEAADRELLLAELRAQRMASAGSLAEALGRDAETVRRELDDLFEAGAVMRTGSGDRARYRAAST